MCASHQGFLTSSSETPFVGASCATAGAAREVGTESCRGFCFHAQKPRASDHVLVVGFVSSLTGSCASAGAGGGGGDVTVVVGGAMAAGFSLLAAAAAAATFLQMRVSSGKDMYVVQTAYRSYSSVSLFIRCVLSSSPKVAIPMAIPEMVAKATGNMRPAIVGVTCCSSRYVM